MRIEFDLPVKFEQALFALARIYNYEHTSDQTKDLILFELHKILGIEYDVIQFCKDVKEIDKSLS